MSFGFCLCERQGFVFCISRTFASLSRHTQTTADCFLCRHDKKGVALRAESGVVGVSRNPAPNSRLTSKHVLGTAERIPAKGHDRFSRRRPPGKILQSASVCVSLRLITLFLCAPAPLREIPSYSFRRYLTFSAIFSPQ